jgi:alanine racemase
VLTIDLNAIQKNWLKLDALTSAAIAGVIKANAYGLGAEEVGKALYAAGCREFFLATFDEAVAARSYLPAGVLIYVLGGLRNIDLTQLHERNLIPVLYSNYDIDKWLIFKKATAANLVAALKINTGMTRFGLDERDFFSLCDKPDRLQAINPALLISHLSCADETDHSQNRNQLQRFAKALEKIRIILPSIRASLANSSGIFLGKEWHFDLVRPGAALYGINPTRLEHNPMCPVLKLALPVVQVRTLDIIESIGYGATANLSAGARIAVVAGGYADGVHRSLGFQPEGLLLGYRVKAVGRISMDSMIFDITNVPVSEDDLMRASVEVIGDLFSLDTLMAKTHSLGYEVLTSLGSRYPRSYLPGIL